MFIEIPFCKTSLKSLYLVIICKLTHLRDGNTKIKFMSRILEKKLMKNLKQDPDPDPKPSEKEDPDPDTDPDPKKSFRVHNTELLSAGLFPDVYTVLKILKSIFI